VSSPVSSRAPYRIAVRELCEFTAKTGDLDHRFTPAPTAQEGIAAHGLVQSRRPAHYERELALCEEFESLQVRGRADGYDPRANRLEEIKTIRGRLESLPAHHRALHWAQLATYGALLCRARGLQRVQLSLVYFDLASQQEFHVTETVEAEALRAQFESRCRSFLGWARQELAHRAHRDAALERLAFPHAAMHGGQRRLIEAAQDAVRDSRPLLAQAPTGTGKTVATLFAMLKSCAAQGLDKVFYLTAKTSGRAPALAALRSLAEVSSEPPCAMTNATAEPPRPRNDASFGSSYTPEAAGTKQALPAPETTLPGAPPHASADAAAAQPSCSPDGAAPGLPLRVLEFVAREDACEFPGRACHGDACPLAKGFYDRLPDARQAALNEARLEQAQVRRIARRHQVCPYYLTQELARWSDVVVGDYNHYFDASAILHALTQAREWRVGLLVDEAHNLLERARQMYSATLDPQSFEAGMRTAPAALRAAFKPVSSYWQKLDAALPGDYQAQPAPPEELLGALRGFCAAAAELLSAGPEQPERALLESIFAARFFLRLSELAGPHSLFDMARNGPENELARTTLTLRNVLPAPHLAPRFSAAAGCALFSATLTPPDFYRDTLGLPENSSFIDVDSPFDPAQLEVRIARRISTRYRDRAASLRPIVELMAAQYARMPGNYLAFLSSFDYLRQVLNALRRRHPSIPTWEQRPRMPAAERADFLAKFTSTSSGIGFAVLGGAFAEGIDLPNERLIGAFITTLGLPPITAVNEEVARRMGEKFGAAFEYTYLYPGLQKVVQAAGRVIRSGEDRGVIHLIDERFREPRVRALLPRWWAIA